MAISLAALEVVNAVLAGSNARELNTGRATRAKAPVRSAQPMSAAFPRSLPEFVRMFPDDSACGKYLEAVRWPDGFACPKCGERGEPFRFAARPSVLRCRVCRHDASLTAGTVMHRTHSPLSQWFWAAYLVSTQTDGMSAVQFQRQIGIGRYETAFQMLHKLRAGMVRPNVDRSHRRKGRPRRNGRDARGR